MKYIQYDGQLYKAVDVMDMNNASKVAKLLQNLSNLQTLASQIDAFSVEVGDSLIERELSQLSRLVTEAKNSVVSYRDAFDRFQP